MFGRNRPRDRRLVDALAAAEDADDNVYTLPASSPPAEPAPPPAPAAPAPSWTGAAARDNEIALIETAWEALNGLSGEAARRRAISYILDRFGYVAKED